MTTNSRVNVKMFGLLILALLMLALPLYGESGQKKVEDYLGPPIKCRRSGDGQPNICPDGTRSFIQPLGGPSGVGLCGPTAVANLICMTCGECSDPWVYAVLGGINVDRGTTPSQLLRATNMAIPRLKVRQCRGYRWAYVPYGSVSNLGWKKSHNTHKDALRWLLTRWPKQRNAFNPVIVGLSTGQKGGHYTTVVRLDGNTVVHNTWGRQYRTPWKTFKWLWMGNEALYLTAPST